LAQFPLRINADWFPRERKSPSVESAFSERDGFRSSGRFVKRANDFRLLLNTE